jgi:hypothetical protein
VRPLPIKCNAVSDLNSHQHECCCSDGTPLVGNGGPHTYGIVTDAPWCQMAEVLQDDALTRNRLALERHAHSLHLLRRKVFQDEMVLVRTPSPTLTLSHSTRWVCSLHERGGSIRLDSATRVLLGKARAGVAGIGSPAPATRPSAGR